MSRLSGALAAAYGALAVLVAAGALTGLDQWSIDHLMPGRPGTEPAPSLADATIPLAKASWGTPLQAAANVVTLPAQAVVSFLLVGGCCLVLARRGRRRAAAVWAGAWVLGNAVEVLCKAVLDRPALYAHSTALVVHSTKLAAFESSFPSGHTLRTVLLAAVAAAVWPAALPWLAGWAAAGLVLLEVDGVHVPSDIAGGLVLALLLGSVARRATV